MNEFLGLLEEEKNILIALLETMQDEKKAVVNSELKELNETSKKKENIILKIRILEEQRVRMLGQLADSIGYSDGVLTLIILSQLVEEPFSSRLMEYHANLLALTHSIHDINKGNNALLLHSIDLIKGSLTLLESLMVSNPLYYRTGTIHNSDQNGKVLSGII